MATSKLQIAVGNLLDKTFPQFRIRENYRPEWLCSSNLTKLELDFYIEELKIAFEIQGAQHFEYVPFFHGDRLNFEKRKLYDQEKKDLCYGQGVQLVELFSLMDAIIEINKIEEYVLRNGIVAENNNEHWIVCAEQIIDRKRDARIKKYVPEYLEKSLEIIARQNHDDVVIEELNRFYRKLKHHHERGYIKKQKPILFGFKCLDEIQAQALVEELDDVGIILQLRQV